MIDTVILLIAELILIAIAVGAVAITVLVLIAVTVGLVAEDREAVEAREQHYADVRDIATGRPRLQLVVDNVGDQVDRTVFPAGDAA